MFREIFFVLYVNYEMHNMTNCQGDVVALKVWAVLLMQQNLTLKALVDNNVHNNNIQLSQISMLKYQTACRILLKNDTVKLPLQALYHYNWAAIKIIYFALKQTLYNLQ